MSVPPPPVAFVPPPPPVATVPMAPPAPVPTVSKGSPGGGAVDGSRVFVPMGANPQSPPSVPRANAVVAATPTMARPIAVPAALNESFPSLNSNLLVEERHAAVGHSCTGSAGTPIVLQPPGTTAPMPQRTNPPTTTPPPPSVPPVTVLPTPPVALAPSNPAVLAALPLPTASPTGGSPAMGYTAPVPVATGQLPATAPLASAPPPTVTVPTAVVSPTVHMVVPPTAAFQVNSIHVRVVDPVPPVRAAPPRPSPTLRKKGCMAPVPKGKHSKKKSEPQQPPLSTLPNRYDFQLSPSTHLHHTHPLANYAATSSTRGATSERRSDEAWRGVYWQGVDVHRYIARQYFGVPPPIEK